MNYTDLQTAIAAFLNRADLYASIPTFIALAEAHMSRRLRVRPMISMAQDVSVASEFVALPSDFSGPISVTLSTGQVLDNLTPDALNEKKYRNSAESGTPDSYAIVGSQIQFNPIPSSALTCVMEYWANLPSLSATNLTNWLIAEHPDAYLYGSLVEAGRFLQKDPRVGEWKQAHLEILAQIEASSAAESFGSRLRPTTLLVI